MAFFARTSMWDSTVSYWSPSVAVQHNAINWVARKLSQRK